MNIAEPAMMHAVIHDAREAVWAGAEVVMAYPYVTAGTMVSTPGVHHTLATQHR
jgi:hypothetical protein